MQVDRSKGRLNAVHFDEKKVKRSGEFQDRGVSVRRYSVEKTIYEEVVNFATLENGEGKTIYDKVLYPAINEYTRWVMADTTASNVSIINLYIFLYMTDCVFEYFDNDMRVFYCV